MSQTAEMDETCEAVQVRLELRKALSDELLAHLKACSDCRHARDVSRAFHGALGSGPEWRSGERVLDQYELLEAIGRGGQGAVFKARDLETGLIVALKVVPLDAHSVSEVLHAAGITHPNVCRINYTRACGPFRVIVMEYVRGGTLRHRLEQGPIPKPEAMALFRGICEGVLAAHQRDVLHLDLKPGNVLLRDGVVPVVSDFGLATVSGSSARGGTTGYMAPEQERGEPVDQRTDVFALGAILAELVPSRSARVQRVINRAREARAEQRVASVAELLRLLDAPRGGALRLGVIAAVGAVAVVGALGWGYLQRARRRTPPSAITAMPERAAPTSPVADTVGLVPPAATTPMPEAGSVRGTPETKHAAAMHGQAFASASPSSVTQQSLADVAAMEAAGNAEGCLRALESMPATPTNGVLPQRGRCLMRAGRCSEGRQVLATTVPAGFGTQATAWFIDATACDRCPAAQMTDEERVYCSAMRVAAARNAGEPAACDRSGHEFLALYQRSPPSPNLDRQWAANILLGAALCLGNAGRCDAGRAMFRARSDLLLGRADSNQSDSMFNQVSHCQPASPVGDGGR